MKINMKQKSTLTAYAFIAPFFILFGLFMVYPVIFSFYLSFHNWDGFSPAQFVGFKNYASLLKDPLFIKALYNTVYIFLISTPLQLIGALFLAALLNLPYIKFKNFFRAAFYLPIITSIVVISVIFLVLYDYDYGLVNYVLSLLGFAKIPWLAAKEWSKIALIIMISWRWTGYNMIIILAGMQAIPEEIYEAATIDGATRTTTFFKITIPLLRPVLIFCYIMMIVGLLQLFTEPYILTKGGPENSSLTVVHYLFKQGFEYFRLGYASTIAYVIFILTFIFSYINMKFLSRGAGEEV